MVISENFGKYQKFTCDTFYFRTIFSVSIIYAAGQIILAIASTKDYTSSIHPYVFFATFLLLLLLRNRWRKGLSTMGCVLIRITTSRHVPRADKILFVSR